ncbi:hypothetical protein CFIO01_07497 [Colletotrichum fioriniae PJ7]|uniref:Uncharacterized protein n=1 Tax=Colletotrichum fioriniae PJ7 TaxID=1445577 RepID=A0A010PZY0_9PEZI|nr:hypothetical protein CFIO01_07497 [Colletotrichum fioriniae PJ7]
MGTADWMLTELGANVVHRCIITALLANGSCRRQRGLEACCFARGARQKDSGEIGLDNATPFSLLYPRSVDGIRGRAAEPRGLGEGLQRGLQHAGSSFGLSCVCQLSRAGLHSDSVQVACIRRKIEDEGHGHVFPPKSAQKLVKGAFLSVSDSVQCEKEQLLMAILEIRRPVTTLHEGSVDGMGKTQTANEDSSSNAPGKRVRPSASHVPGVHHLEEPEAPPEHRLSTAAATGEFHLFSGIGQLLAGCWRVVVVN